ncbi:MAG: nicotinate-nucleotide adenylyltransferase [Firmicutes bacterium]|nr:nicotinate-nucleotide adenylyltransferase [Bacillota bacterium]
MDDVTGLGRRLGVMGGTFDPIHYGHLVTAEAAAEEFDLEQVIFVPAGQPPHKPPGAVSDAGHRYLMTVLATLANPRFAVSRVDIERPGPSYTVDTLRELRRQFGSGVELYFITGADAMLQILQWKDPESLFELCHFIAATRPGYGLSRLEKVLGPTALRHRDRILPLQVPALAISSTDIRRRVREGRSVRYLLPDAVAHYIAKSGLYAEKRVARA